MSEQPIPAKGDRYVKRAAPDEGRVITVNRVWIADDGHTAVAYEWDDPRASYAGSACPLDVFHRTYAAEPIASNGQARTVLDLGRNALNARMAKDDLRLVLENVITYAASLEDQRDRRRARLVALQNDALSMRGSLSPAGENSKVPFPLGETLTPAVDWLIARVAELETQREALAERLRAGQRWQRGRTPELVSENFVSQSELRSIFGIALVAPWDEPGYDPCHPCGCPKRFDRHADGCPSGGAR